MPETEEEHFTVIISSKKSRTTFCLLLAVTFALGAVGPGAAADKKKQSSAVKSTPALPPSTPPATPLPSSPLVTSTATVTATGAQTVVSNITQDAVKGGVLACAGRINQVANFLTGGNQGVGAFIFLPPTDQDQRLTSFSIEVPSTTGASSYASAGFAPNQANGCGGMYESLTYWPQGCAAVAAGAYGALKRGGILAKEIMVLDGGPMTRIFLMPAGTGCLSIKKEIVL